MPTRYRSNSPRVVDETLDGEALIMDMVKGNYYNCLGPSAVAWNALKNGASPTEVVDGLAAAYGVERPQIEREMDAFVSALLADELLVENRDPPPASSFAIGLGSPGAYTTLGIERHTDLADLILLDPVHDVTDDGWPNPSS